MKNKRDDMFKKLDKAINKIWKATPATKKDLIESEARIIAAINNAGGGGGGTGAAVAKVTEGLKTSGEALKQSIEKRVNHTNAD